MIEWDKKTDKCMDIDDSNLLGPHLMNYYLPTDFNKSELLCAHIVHGVFGLNRTRQVKKQSY